MNDGNGPIVTMSDDCDSNLSESQEAIELNISGSLTFAGEVVRTPGEGVKDWETKPENNFQRFWRGVQGSRLGR